MASIASFHKPFSFILMHNLPLNSQEIAVTTLSASTVAFTSCTRTIFAPFMTEITAAAILAYKRWPSSPPAMTPRTDSVSYTHLDVYKRQGLGDASLFRPIAALGDAFIRPTFTTCD